jgi:hypothetical protein
VRRWPFWLAVGGVSILAQFGLELVNERFPQLGLARFTAFTHKGAS